MKAIIPDNQQKGSQRMIMKKTVFTDRQLRALSKKHLLLMIRDLEKELSREKQEKENLLLAYHAGAAQMPKKDNV